MEKILVKIYDVDVWVRLYACISNSTIVTFKIFLSDIFFNMIHVNLWFLENALQSECEIFNEVFISSYIY